MSRAEHCGPDGVSADSPLRLLLDLATPSSAGGERLKVELAHAADRTLPAGSRGFVLARPQHELCLNRLEPHTVETDLSSRIRKLHWLHAGVPRWVTRTGANATFAASGFFGGRLLSACAVVSTANNMLPFTPELSSEHPSTLQLLRLRLLRTATVHSLRRADSVLLHSVHALDSISPFVPNLSSKARVVPTGIPKDARLTAPPPPHPYAGRPYFLYFSPLKPYKNHRTLIEAYGRLAERRHDLPELLFAGHRSSPSYLQSIRSQIRRARLEDRIRYLGEVDRAAMQSWMHHATVNFFPSLCETNSIIQTEILGANGVMAAADLPPMNQTPQRAAALFDPYDPDDVSRVMEALWVDPERRQLLRNAAQEAAGRFSWDACGAVLWQLALQARGTARSRLGHHT